MDTPTRFTQAMADRICDRLIMGQSLATICDEEGMPHVGTVGAWRKKHPEFEAQYMMARELQAEALFEEMLDIADDSRNDWVERERKDGSTFIALNTEAVQRSKLRLDLRLKMLERMNPSRYGAKVQLDHKSSDGSMSPERMTDEQKADKISAIIARAEARRKAATAVDDGSDLV